MVFCVLSLRFWTTVVIYLVPIWMTCVFVENRVLPTTSVPKVNLVHLRLFWVHRVNKCMPLWQSWAHFHQDERCNGTSDTRRACEDDSEVWKSSWGLGAVTSMFSPSAHPFSTGAPTRTCCFFCEQPTKQAWCFCVGWFFWFHKLGLSYQWIFFDGGSEPQTDFHPAEDPWNLRFSPLFGGLEHHRNHQTSMTYWGFQPLVVGESTDQLLYMWIWVASIQVWWVGIAASLQNEGQIMMLCRRHPFKCWLRIWGSIPIWPY